MKAKELLKTAQNFIKKGWCQEHYALDAEGNQCAYENAAKHCSMGAIDHAFLIGSQRGTITIEHKLRALNCMSLVTGGVVITWNDVPHRTQEDVLKMFEQAIALCDKMEEEEHAPDV